MNYLIDTHIFIWYINGDKNLRENTKEIIESKTNTIFLSVVSLWEIIIKAKLGKIDIPKPIYNYLIEKRDLHQIESLDLDENCLKYLEYLEDIHKDPFDRLLICQSLDNKFILLSDDLNILKYKKINS